MIDSQRIPVTVFSSADDGAPQLAPEAGSLKTVLKACLHTGYGQKTALGWAMPFEEANHAVFRSQEASSNRHFLQVLNAGTRHARVNAYTQMTGLRAGTGKFSYEGNSERLGYYGYRPMKWWLIGHQKAFCLLMSEQEGKNSVGFFFGDFVSLAAGDTGNTLFCHNSSSSYDYFSVDSFSSHINGNNNVGIAKKYNGLEQKASGVLGSLNRGWNTAYPDPIHQGLSAAEVFVEEGINSSVHLRGLMFGLLWVRQNLSEFNEGLPFTLDGQSDVYLKFCLHSSNNYANILINATAWEG